MWNSPKESARVPIEITQESIFSIATLCQHYVVSPIRMLISNKRIKKIVKLYETTIVLQKLKIRENGILNIHTRHWARDVMIGQHWARDVMIGLGHDKKPDETQIQDLLFWYHIKIYITTVVLRKLKLPDNSIFNVYSQHWARNVMIGPGRG